MTAHRIVNAILLQGPILAEVRWVLSRGTRDIWRTDSVPPSAAITRVLGELERAIAAATSEEGSAELPPPPTWEELVSTGPEDQLTTQEAARMLGITARQVRNLADRLGGRKIGTVLTLDRAAVEVEIARRGAAA